MKNRIIVMFILFFFIISIVGVYSTSYILPSDYRELYLKQLIWYLIGFIIMYLIYRGKKGFFYKYSVILYIIGNLLLLLVLFFGTRTNGAIAWFNIPGIGTFQPSEFMKICLIILFSTELDKYNKMVKNIKTEFTLIIKCLFILLIPTILTFLEPDTGNVIIYIIIYISMLFAYGIGYKWVIITGLICIVGITLFGYLYFYKKELFVNIFGTNFFYRIDRLLEWKNKEGMQLENALAAIGSSPKYGYGIGKTPIYIPEANTDFISSVIISNIGFYLSTGIILLFLLFDILLIILAIKNNNINRYLIVGILSILFFQQIQNIGMNIGILPITGITLPFISYGGSSLISYLILISLITNINKQKKQSN